MEGVPDGVDVVAGVLGVLGVVVVLVAVLGVVVVLVFVELVAVLVVLAVDVVCPVQSLVASSPTVLAPCLRLLASVGLTEGGRLCTSLLSCETALCAVPQLRASSAEET